MNDTLLTVGVLQPPCPYPYAGELCDVLYGDHVGYNFHLFQVIYGSFAILMLIVSVFLLRQFMAINNMTLKNLFLGNELSLDGSGQRTVMLSSLVAAVLMCIMSVDPMSWSGVYMLGSPAVLASVVLSLCVHLVARKCIAWSYIILNHIVLISSFSNMFDALTVVYCSFPVLAYIAIYVERWLLDCIRLTLFVCSVLALSAWITFFLRPTVLFYTTFPPKLFTRKQPSPDLAAKREHVLKIRSREFTAYSVWGLFFSVFTCLSYVYNVLEWIKHKPTYAMVPAALIPAKNASLSEVVFYFLPLMLMPLIFLCVITILHLVRLYGEQRGPQKNTGNTNGVNDFVSTRELIKEKEAEDAAEDADDETETVAALPLANASSTKATTTIAPVAATNYFPTNSSSSAFSSVSSPCKVHHRKISSYGTSLTFPVTVSEPRLSLTSKSPSARRVNATSLSVQPSLAITEEMDEELATEFSVSRPRGEDSTNNNNNISLHSRTASRDLVERQTSKLHFDAGTGKSLRGLPSLFCPDPSDADFTAKLEKFGKLGISVVTRDAPTRDNGGNTPTSGSVTPSRNQSTNRASKLLQTVGVQLFAAKFNLVQFAGQKVVSSLSHISANVFYAIDMISDILVGLYFVADGDTLNVCIIFGLVLLPQPFVLAIMYKPFVGEVSRSLHWEGTLFTTLSVVVFVVFGIPLMMLLNIFLVTWFIFRPVGDIHLLGYYLLTRDICEALLESLPQALYQLFLFSSSQTSVPVYLIVTSILISFANIFRIGLTFLSLANAHRMHLYEYILSFFRGTLFPARHVDALRAQRCNKASYRHYCLELGELREITNAISEGAAQTGTFSVDIDKRILCSELDMSYNATLFANNHAVSIFSEFLGSYSFLATLRLAGNKLDDNAVRVLLFRSYSYIELDLSDNEISLAGAHVLKMHLTMSTSLIWVDLSRNRIPISGCKLLVHAMQSNTSILHLDLSNQLMHNVLHKRHSLNPYSLNAKSEQRSDSNSMGGVSITRSSKRRSQSGGNGKVQLVVPGIESKAYDGGVDAGQGGMWVPGMPAARLSLAGSLDGGNIVLRSSQDFSRRNSGLNRISIILDSNAVCEVDSENENEDGKDLTCPNLLPTEHCTHDNSASSRDQSLIGDLTEVHTADQKDDMKRQHIENRILARQLEEQQGVPPPPPPVPPRVEVPVEGNSQLAVQADLEKAKKETAGEKEDKRVSKKGSGIGLQKKKEKRMTLIISPPPTSSVQPVISPFPSSSPALFLSSSSEVAKLDQSCRIEEEVNGEDEENKDIQSASSAIAGTNANAVGRLGLDGVAAVNNGVRDENGMLTPQEGVTPKLSQKIDEAEMKKNRLVVIDKTPPVVSDSDDSGSSNDLFELDDYNSDVDDVFLNDFDDELAVDYGEFCWQGSGTLSNALETALIVNRVIALCKTTKKFDAVVAPVPPSRKAVFHQEGISGV